MVNTELYNDLKTELSQQNVTLVAVSKTKPIEDIRALYDLGQRHFGENYVQELAAKATQLPSDIHWHFIGHLQSNKVKQIAGFVQLIQGVDSLSLLKEINKQALKVGRTIDCLLQMHIAIEETKFGLDEYELAEILQILPSMGNVRVKGLMGMASFTAELEAIEEEFKTLAGLFKKNQQYFQQPTILSMGMSGDYRLAIEQGSNMVRIGSLLFGERAKK